jgi:hypothetical protein
MRQRTLGALVAFALALGALPGAATGATPPRWPTVSDVRNAEPGIAADDAACMARFFRGRLSRSDWLAPYFSRTPAQKRTRSAGRAHCMTLDERVATVEQGFVDVLGRHAELHCVARTLEARGWAVRLAVTSRLQEFRLYDRIFRACGFMGVVYDLYGHQFHLALTGAERRCANGIGSVVPLYPQRDGQIRTQADKRETGAVFDRCVGRASESAMWRSIVHDLKPVQVVPCVAQRLTRSATFVTLFTDKVAMDRLGNRALVACRLSVPPPAQAPARAGR